MYVREYFQTMYTYHAFLWDFAMTKCPTSAKQSNLSFFNQ